MIKSKSEIDSTLLVYSEQDFMTTSTKGSSDGCSPKYTDGSLWIKVDTNGYEALAEVLACRVIQALGYNCVEYKPCFLVVEELARSSCVSKSFQHAGLQETTLGRELCKLTELDSLYTLMLHLEHMQSVSERIDFVISTLKPYINSESLYKYIAVLLWLDSIMFNGDRHLHNILLFRTQTKLLLAPYFDFGDSFLSNVIFKYPLQMTAACGIRKVKSKPFSSTFKKQVQALSEYLPADYPHLISVKVDDLYDYFRVDFITRAIDVLKLGLAQYNIELQIEDSSKAIRTNHFMK